MSMPVTASWFACIYAGEDVAEIVHQEIADIPYILEHAVCFVPYRADDPVRERSPARDVDGVAEDIDEVDAAVAVDCRVCRFEARVVGQMP